MPLHLITAPDQDDVLTLAAAKKHLRIDFNDDDDLIDSYIAAAVQNLDGRDGWLGRALAPQLWELRLPAFDGPEIKVPLPPLIAVESVTYYDAGDVLRTLAADQYEVAGIGGFGKARVVLRSGLRWPETARRIEAVMVRFSAGYVTNDDPPAAAVPAPIVTAIKRQVGAMYEHREAVVVGSNATTLPGGVEALLAPYRVW